MRWVAKVWEGVRRGAKGCEGVGRGAKGCEGVRRGCEGVRRGAKGWVDSAAVSITMACLKLSAAAHGDTRARPLVTTTTRPSGGGGGGVHQHEQQKAINGRPVEAPVHVLGRLLIFIAIIIMMMVHIAQSKRLQAADFSHPD